MKRLGIHLSVALRPPRPGALALPAILALTLAACGSPAENQTASDSASNSAASTEVTNDAGESLTENFTGSEALAQSSEAPVDAEEVQTTEKLYSDIQKALAGIEPASTAASQEAASDELAGDTENVQATEEAVESYVSSETTSQLEAAATGAALDQYLATATEYALAGWHIEGSSTVVGTPRIADGDYQGQAAKILEVCLDSSQVKVADDNGNTISAPQFTRSLNIFTLVEDKGTWKIASHDFPNDADC